MKLLLKIARYHDRGFRLRRRKRQNLDGEPYVVMVLNSSIPTARADAGTYGPRTDNSNNINQIRGSVSISANNTSLERRGVQELSRDRKSQRRPKSGWPVP